MRLDAIIKSEKEDIVNILDHQINTVALALANTATILDAKKIVFFGSMFTNDKISDKLAKQIKRYNVGIAEEAIGAGKFSSKSSYIGATAVASREFFFESEE